MLIKSRNAPGYQAQCPPQPSSFLIFKKDRQLTRPTFPASTTVWCGSETRAQLHMMSLVPRPSWLQFLIASSMPKWRGKAWEIQSHAMTLDRQRVDTQEAMPNCRNS